MSNPVRVTAPTVLPISLATAKAHLRVDTSSEDVLINQLIEEATGYLDGYSGILGRCIMTQTWDVYYDAWPCDGNLRIPLPPLQSVTWLKYRNTAGTWITVDPADYEVDPYQLYGWIVPGNSGWPSDVWDGNSIVQARFVAGYGSSPNDIPPLLRKAIKTMIGDAYKFRESYVDGSFQETPAIRRAIDPLRIMAV